MKFKLNTLCVNVPQHQTHKLENMYEAERKISFTTFARKCNWQEVARTNGYSVGAEKGLHLKDDYAVSFARSKFDGQDCYVMHWSAIDHIFLRAS